MHQRMIKQTDKWMNGRTNDIMGIIKTKLHFLFINIANLLLNLVCNNMNVNVQFVNVNVNIENTATEFNVCPQYHSLQIFGNNWFYNNEREYS